MLDHLAFVQFLKVSPFGYPLLEIVHIAGIALLFGNLVLVDLRLLGWAQPLEAKALARFALRLTLLGFFLCAFTGALMILARLEEMFANRILLVKFGLLTLAACNAAILHSRKGIETRDTITKVQAALSIVIWLCVIAAGRWIAYK